MYERFTDRARKVMQIANEQARSYNHEYIGTEHLLLGLLKENSGIASLILRDLKLKAVHLSLCIDEKLHVGPIDISSTMKLPHTPRAKKVLELAIEEAKTLGNNYVGTEHILFGLIREHEGIAGQVLDENGVSYDRALKSLSRMRTEWAAAGETEAGRDMIVTNLDPEEQWKEVLQVVFQTLQNNLPTKESLVHLETILRRRNGGNESRNSEVGEKQHLHP